MTDLEKAARLALDAMGLVGADLVCGASSHHRRTDLHGDEDVCPIRSRWHDAFEKLSRALAQQAEPVVETTDRELLLQIYTAINNERAAERTAGKPTGGFIPRPGTWEWQRRIAAASKEVQLALEAIQARLAGESRQQAEPAAVPPHGFNCATRQGGECNCWNAFLSKQAEPVADDDSGNPSY
jgi:hypothetical protein